jgi:predicted nucleotidyltransferase
MTTGVEVYLEPAQTPEGIESALHTVRAIAGSRRVICVLACDGETASGMRPLAARAAINGSDFCILTVGDPGRESPASIVMQMLRGVPQARADRMKTIVDRHAAMAAATDAALPDGIVVVMGKHATTPDQQFILDVIHRRYGTPSFCFFFGSHAFGHGDAESDIDLIVVQSRVTQACRETFSADGFLFDVQVHDPETLHYVMTSEYKSGLAIMAAKVDQSLVLPEPCATATKLKDIARRMLDSGPAPQKSWDPPRRLLTAALSDLERCADPDEQRMMAMDLYVRSIDLFLRFNGQFTGTGRYLVRYAKNFDPAFHDCAQAALERVFRDGSVAAMVELVREVVNRMGGPLDAGYRQSQPEHCRLPLP